jgi:hypothetical protein
MQWLNKQNNYVRVTKVYSNVLVLDKILSRQASIRNWDCCFFRNVI